MESRRTRFSTLAAATCRKIGAIVVSANIRDLERIARVFAFDYVAPYLRGVLQDICRECFIRLYTLSLYTLSTHAFEKYFGPIRPGLPLQLMLDHELLWVEAATQVPVTMDLEEINRRYHELMAQKYEVSAKRKSATLSRRWVSKGTRRGREWRA